MPLLFQTHIHNADLRRNPGVLYVFGDNVSRRGRGGQAKAMRGEPNAVGVATKYHPYSFFAEDPLAVVNQNRIIDIDMKPLFEAVKRGDVVIWPADGIGTGLADLQNRSPGTWAHLESKLVALARAAQLFHKGL